MYTGKFVNPDNEPFVRRLNNKIYVDKSNLINFCNEYIESEKCLMCSTRPRRFGKSLAINMLAAYYSKGCRSNELFKNLKVNQYNANKKHEVLLHEKFLKNMNAYDVIYIDMQYVMPQAKNANKALTLKVDKKKNDDKLVSVVDWLTIHIKDELKNIYPNYVKDEHDLVNTLWEISKNNGSKFVILIDEWDALFRFDKENINAQEEYIELLRLLFKGQVADKFVAFAYITGILPIKKYGTESALNNFREYTMVQPKMMSEYIGFTESEVQELCDEYDMDFDEMKNWYDGYLLKGEHVYSPNSVCEAIENREMMKYWVSTETYESLTDYISLNMDGLKDDIVSMIANGRCEADVEFFKNDLVSFTSKDDVIACLVHLGYLAYDADSSEVYIPNDEVRKVFEKAVKETDWTEVDEAIKESKKLLRYTLSKKADLVAQGVERIHSQNA